MIHLERHVTIEKNERWVSRNCETMMYVTSLGTAQDSPTDLLALVRGHWMVEHLYGRGPSLARWRLVKSSSFPNRETG